MCFRSAFCSQEVSASAAGSPLSPSPCHLAVDCHHSPHRHKLLFIYLSSCVFSVFPAVLRAPPGQRRCLGAHDGARCILTDSMSKGHFGRSHGAWQRKSRVLNNNPTNLEGRRRQLTCVRRLHVSPVVSVAFKNNLIRDSEKLSNLPRITIRY